MDNSYRSKNKWQSQFIHKKSKNHTRNERPRKHSSNSAKRTFGTWSWTATSSSFRILDMIDSKALCRNHSDPYDDFYFDEYDNNDTYDYDEFEANIPSKTYDSVYLSDYINDHDLNYEDTTISSSDPEMDSEFQCAIISSLESSHRPLPSKSKASKESKPKKSRKSRRKIKENSFENYWNECMKFNKTLKNKRKSKENKSTKKEPVGMSDSQQSQINKVLR